MISEFIPVVGYYQTMIILSYSADQIQQIIKGSTYESTS